VRARRRFAELARGGAAPDEAAVLADIRARDARDTGRAEAPLRQAADAVLLDTGDLGIEEAIRQAVDIVSMRLDRSA
jgi:cytidylate kinase